MNKKYEFVEGDEKVTLTGSIVKRIRALIAIRDTAVVPGDLGGYIQQESNLDDLGAAWVCDNAQVYGNAQVTGGARVCCNAHVYGNARIYGDARVYGNAEITGNARVYGSAHVFGNACVHGNACVCDDAWVHGNAHVYDDVWVYDHARVSGDACVYNNAQVCDDAQVSGNALVSDAARVAGGALVYGNGLIFWASKVGTQNGTLTVYNTKDNGLFVTCGCFSGTPAEFLARSAKRHDERIYREYSLLIDVATSRIEAARAKSV